MKVEFLKDCKVSLDGHKLTKHKKGDKVDLPDDLAKGLLNEGTVTKAKAEKKAPKKKEDKK